jgi:hypothetical protein
MRRSRANFLRRLEAARCRSPVTVAWKGLVRPDGLAPRSTAAFIRHQVSGPVSDAAALGVELAEVLLSRGADIILQKLTSTAR